jgi:hypothetical protein
MKGTQTPSSETKGTYRLLTDLTFLTPTFWREAIAYAIRMLIADWSEQAEAVGIAWTYVLRYSQDL